MSKQRMVAILVVLCAARTARANDWTELGSDCEQTRNSSEVSGPIFTPSWTYALSSGQIVATPVSAGGDVVVAGSNGAVAALNSVDGTLLWTRTLSGGVRATPTVSGDQVAVSTMGGALISLNLADGGIAWQRAFGGQNYSSPQLIKKASPDDADTLVVGAGFPSQDVWRFNALTGEPLWQTTDGAIVDLVDSTAALAGDRLVVGMNGGRYQSLDLASGALGWKVDVGGQVALSSPLVVGSRVYMFPGDKGAQLFAADASTGAPIAGFPVAIPDLTPVAGGQMFGQGPAVSSPMTIGGLVIVQLRRNDMLPSNNSFKVVMRESVAAIDPISAQVRWQYTLSTQTAPNSNGVPGLNACPTPAGFSGPNGSYVVVSSSIEGRMAVLDVLTGQERWTTTLSSPGRSSPVFSNGQLLIATDDSLLHAFSSLTNHAPTAPTVVTPSGDQAFASAGNELDWQGASDAEGGSLSYVVRLEKEGQPQTRAEAQTTAGQTRMLVALEPTTAYLFAVRSRDAQGALSAWSITQRIQIGAGTPAPSAPLADDTAATATASVPSDAMMAPPSAPPTSVPPPPPTASAASTPPAAPPPTPAPPPSCAPASGTAPMAANAAPASPSGTLPTQGSTSPAGSPSPSTAMATATQLALATTAHATSTTLASTLAAKLSASDDPGLADRGGCSLAGGSGSSPASVFVLGLLVVIVRGRTRYSAKRKA
jgi:outer membrane protein assembly factor BamB